MIGDAFSDRVMVLLFTQMSLMNKPRLYTFSYSNLFDVARNLRKQRVRIELTPPLRRKLENDLLARRQETPELADRVLARRALEELKLSEVLQCIRTSTCQYCCGEGKLISYKLRKVTSFLVRYRVREQAEFACRSCACKRLAHASLHTLLMGWWSSGGARSAPYAIFCNLRTLVLQLSEAEMEGAVRMVNRAGSLLKEQIPTGEAAATIIPEAPRLDVAG